MAGCVGVAGSATHRRALHGGRCAIVLGHLTLADNVHISAATVVTRSILKPGHYTGVFPIDDNAAWEKNAATLKQLHSLRERIKRSSGSQRKPEEQTLMMDIHQILKQLPHRYPFLLVDRVLELEKASASRRSRTSPSTSPSSWATFPHRPVMPGVLMLEALAQAAALLSFETDGRDAGRQLGVLLCRHRRRALQAAGGAG
jgi:hypothetical protein